MNQKTVKELRRCLSEYYTEYPSSFAPGWRRVAGEGSTVYSPRRMFYRRCKRLIEREKLSASDLRTKIFTMLGGSNC